jgi:hypothetical protein
MDNHATQLRRVRVVAEQLMRIVKDDGQVWISSHGNYVSPTMVGGRGRRSSRYQSGASASDPKRLACGQILPCKSDNTGAHFHVADLLAALEAKFSDRAREREYREPTAIC